MGKKLYVGNLSYRINSDDLRQLFIAHGAVQSAQIIMERDTERSKGFGFVEMVNDDEALSAIAALHDAVVDGRPMVVNEARPMEARSREDGKGGGGRFNKPRTGNGGNREGRAGRDEHAGAGRRESSYRNSAPRNKPTKP